MPLKLEKAVSPSEVAVVVEPDEPIVVEPDEPIVDGNVASSPDPVVPVDLDDPAVTSLRILPIPIVVVPVVPAVPAVVPVDTGDLKPPAMTNVLPMTAHPG